MSRIRSKRHHMVTAVSTTLLLSGWGALDVPSPAGDPSGAVAVATCEVTPDSRPGASIDDRYRPSITPGLLLHWAE
ncbi:hypothetical protein M3148_12020 [Georgenia satyanarayanai]|uniref:hypothetical protein n=1 Tax=Georgenia satyanarayanai TaxID=860221 RepID=UPI00203D1B5D|nr:hypothetical protein [Georgenia satyanarayanai]MCM3661706.1 hypothetical protein [Georgenia satyanarayanai]